MRCHKCECMLLFIISSTHADFQRRIKQHPIPFAVDWLESEIYSKTDDLFIDFKNMKRFIILNIILCNLLVYTTVTSHPDSRYEAITAQSVTSDLTFVQNFIQLLNQLFTNFNTLFPKFINLFTTTAPAALTPPNLRNPIQGALPSMPEISATAPNYDVWPSGKINNAHKDRTDSIIHRDVELIERDVD